MFKYIDYLKNLWITVFNLVFLVLFNIVSIPSRFRRRFKGNGRIHLLGTGPSLKEDLDKLVELASPDDTLLCVNGFATSDLYERIKPNMYLLADGGFFNYGLSENLEKFVCGVYDAINKKTNWKLNLVVPDNKFNSRRLKVIDNSNISILTFDNIPISGGLRAFNAYLYYLKLATPLYQNVLNCAICFAIRSGFNQVYLWGADHNWMNYFKVLADNKVYSVDPHFYDDNVSSYRPTSIRNIPSELDDESRCFWAYHELRMYADLKKVKVLNCSSNSMIDAFERL